MKLLFIGDIVGRSGRQAVFDHLPGLRRDLGLDAVVANAENSAGGFGLTRKIADELFQAGVDVITTGNHVWDQRELLSEIESEPRIVRPLNFPDTTPGRGDHILTLPGNRKLLVINVMGRLFMNPLDDPFAAVDRILKRQVMGASVDAVLVDVHAEATSEKQAMGRHLDGRVSVVVGTHTHVPTSDIMILKGGTAYQTDAGMTGDYDSVIGMKPEAPVSRFTRQLPTERLEAAAGEATLCGLFVGLDPANGRARQAGPVRVGGLLAPALPTI